MSQLIIDFNHKGEWKEKYYGSPDRKAFKKIKVPNSLKGNDWILGDVMDFRNEWRKKLDEHTKNAEYDIIKLEPIQTL